MTVDPADMWAYATRPITDSDPNEPLLAVLRAADAAEPRVVRVGEGLMADARYVDPRALLTEDEWRGHHDPLAVARSRAADSIADAKQRTRRDVAAVIT